MDCLEILDQRVKLGILAFQGKLDQRETEENWVFQVLSVKRVMKETRDLPDTGLPGHILEMPILSSNDTSKVWCYRTKRPGFIFPM
ncbi:hypothetical protein Y1Q_0019039 [Alligator mississippiensis]|uniref:Uncharacterized protein n=1 Tax=Alligator mississippiensis TaxID=8496 RepID=A0A151NP23_ALLMI|nr:hypothetical protein Y1Q_0019039 [Alligator mississippiensis]